MRLGHARGDGAHAHLRNQLDADARSRVRVLQIVDELGEILDGVDIVVRRRTDEPHARRGITDSRDGLVHLAPREFAAFPGLGALGHLDLQFVGVGQVPDGDSEPPGGHLLDGRTLRIAGRQWDVPFRVLAAFTGIAAPAHAVHRHRQGLVRFGGNRAETHGPRAEAPDDLLRRLHLVERDGGTFHPRLQPQQSPQGAIGARFVVGLFGKLCVRAAGAAARGLLQRGNDDGIPAVALAPAAPVEFARVRQRRQPVAPLAGISQRVPPQRFLLEHVHTHALEPACGAGEASLDDLVGETHGLENLRPLVGLQRGNAHLRHDLEHALGHTLAIRRDHSRVVGMLDGIQQPFRTGVRKRLERQVRVDGVGAVADQQAMMVNFACFAGFKHNADPGAFRPAHEVMVHRAAGGQAADGYAVCPHIPVRQDQDAVTLVDGRFCLGTDPVQRSCHAPFREIAGEGDVDGPGSPAAMIQVLQRRQLFVVENRVGHSQPMGVSARGFQQVGLRSHVTLQRHDHFFPDRIDRGIGDLGKQLLEVVVEHARLVAQAGQGRVVAHGTHRVAQLFHQRLQHELHGFDGVAERLHPRQQCRGVQPGGGLPRRGRQVLERQPFGLEPLAIGRPVGEFLLQFLVRHQSAGYEVDEKHTTGFKSALVPDHGRIHRQHADFAGHDDPVVVGQVVAARPQAVAVQHRTDVLAVREGDGRRTVPGFHHAGVKFVERPLVLGHQGIFLPRLRDHHHDRLLQRAAGHEQKLKHIVEHAGIGAVRLYHREQLLD